MRRIKAAQSPIQAFDPSRCAVSPETDAEKDIALPHFKTAKPIPERPVEVS